MLKTRYIEDGLIEVGIDEAGRGPLWGPMMAAAVVWPAEADWTDAHRDLAPSIQDSKKISIKKREKISEQIKKLAVTQGIGSVTAAEIDTFGATRANQMAFRRAVKGISENVTGERRLLIDGIINLQDCKEGEVSVTIVEGDAKQMAIAAASILAKVSHDQWVTEWCKENVADAAKYDLLSCKGQGTAKHRDGILRHGQTDHHRRLYLRKLIPGIVVQRYQITEEETEE